MTAVELIESLQQALPELGKKAPVYLLIDNNELYAFEVTVLPKGNLGPGSVVLTGKKP